jgi:hypothetical protein
MEQQKLKVKEVANAKVAEGERLLSDGGCLFLRVRPWSKTWLFIYRSPNGRRKINPGSVHNQAHPLMPYASEAKETVHDQ